MTDSTLRLPPPGRAQNAKPDRHPGDLKFASTPVSMPLDAPVGICDHCYGEWRRANVAAEHRAGRVVQCTHVLDGKASGTHCNIAFRTSRGWRIAFGVRLEDYKAVHEELAWGRWPKALVSAEYPAGEQEWKP